MPPAPWTVLGVDGRGLALPREPQRRGEQVALGPVAELHAADGERLAWHSAGQQVNPAELPAVEAADVALDHLPARPVEAQRAAGVRVDLGDGRVLEAGLLQAEGLAAAARAYL